MKYLKATLLITVLTFTSIAAGVSQPRKSLSQASAIPASYFGITINQPLATPWPQIPFASLRLWDTKSQWIDISRVQNEYNWSTLDSIIALAETHGVDLVYTIGGYTPQWASANPSAPPSWRPGQCSPPSNIQYWDDFIRAIVTHTAGRIKYWEIWNEPQDVKFYCGDIATMVTLERHAYDIIRSLDSSSQILTPSPTASHGPQWMADFLAAGGGNYADIMTFHGYVDTTAESIVTTIRKYKKIFGAYNQKLKPIWDTEASWGTQSELNDRDLQAAFLAKYYLLHWAADISRLYWYSYDSPYPDGWGKLWENISGLRKAGTAYNEVHKWMIGAKMNMPCSQSYSLMIGVIWTCRFSRPGGYRALAIWKTSGSSSYLAPPQYKQYRDLDGKVTMLNGRPIPIGNKPILLESHSLP